MIVPSNVLMAKCRCGGFLPLPPDVVEYIDRGAANVICGDCSHQWDLTRGDLWRCTEYDNASGRAVKYHKILEVQR